MVHVGGRLAVSWLPVLAVPLMAGMPAGCTLSSLVQGLGVPD